MSEKFSSGTKNFKQANKQTNNGYGLIFQLEFCVFVICLHDIMLVCDV